MVKIKINYVYKFIIKDVSFNFDFYMRLKFPMSLCMHEKVISSKQGPFSGLVKKVKVN